MSTRPLPRAPRAISIRLIVSALCAIVVVCSSAAIARAGGESTSLPKLDEIVTRRAGLAAQIEALGKHDAGAEGDADVSAAEDESEFLESLDGVYAQQQARLEQLQELQVDQKKATEELESLHKYGPTEAKPYSFLLLEDLRDELTAEEDRDEILGADLKPAEQLLAAAETHFNQSEKERRHVQEEAAENKDEEHEADLAASLKVAQRESQLAKESIVVRRLEIEVRTLRHEVCAARKSYLTEKVERIGKDVRFTKSDLNGRLKELTTSEAEANSKLKDARTRFKRSELQQAGALRQLREKKSPPAVIELATESWRVARDAQQTEVTLLSERISDSNRLAHYWTCRFEVENGTAKPAELAVWQENLRKLVDEFRDNCRSLEQRIATTRVEEAKIVRRMANSDDPAVEQWGEFQQTQWHQLRDVCETHLVQLKVNERWSSRFLDELDARIDPPSAESWWKTARTDFDAVWDYEFGHVGDNPITVGKVVTLVVCMGLGAVLAKMLSRVLGRRILPHFGLNEGASHAIQSITFYSLSILFGVLSLQLVHIPLAAFAFMGGAIAIAIGFGSQDIANNFMSGIIILAEQPIRVGDVVSVDTVQGTVQHIGPRSTRIKTDCNHELIVPNSKLLSDKVTNLTLSDTLIRTAVAVTLPPKLPVAQAKQLLLGAALSQASVQHKPHPVVLFKQFSATSMDFELHFWLRLEDDMQAALAQSAVREAINDVFQQVDAPATITAAAAKAA